MALPPLDEVKKVEVGSLEVPVGPKLILGVCFVTIIFYYYSFHAELKLHAHEKWQDCRCLSGLFFWFLVWIGLFGFFFLGGVLLIFCAFYRVSGAMRCWRRAAREFTSGSKMQAQAAKGFWMQSLCLTSLWMELPGSQPVFLESRNILILDISMVYFNKDNYQ